MVGSNLPPDVTPGDIDDAFGAPDKQQKTVEFTVDVLAETTDLPDDAVTVSASGGRNAAAVVHIDCIETVAEGTWFVVYVSLGFETSRRDASAVVSDARSHLSVSVGDVVKTYQIVNGEVLA